MDPLFFRLEKKVGWPNQTAVISDLEPDGHCQLCVPRRSNSSAVILSRNIIESLTRSFLRSLFSLPLLVSSLQAAYKRPSASDRIWQLYELRTQADSEAAANLPC